ncbi:MAG: hypothetical protein M3Y59_24885 [Myxococcota bacterium]|nr:hypothetical protein [Myxococcota bacterium]
MATSVPVEWARRGGQALYLTGVLLVALLLSYLLGANALVNSRLLRRVLNPNQEFSRISWDFAYTYWPRRVDVHNLAIVGQGMEVQWELQVAHARGWISLLPLLRRRFIAEEVAAHGVVVRVRPTVAPTPLRLEQAQAFPPITGLESPPLRYEGPLRPPEQRAWTVDLRAVQFDDVRQVWIGPYRSELSGSFRGDLQTRGGWNVYFNGSGVVRQAQVFVREESVVAEATVRLSAAMDLADLPSSLNEERLRTPRGTLQGEARGISLSLISAHLPQTAGRISGVGDLKASVGYLGGKLTAGSQLSLEGRDGGFALEDRWSLTAPRWSVDARVEAGAARLTATVRPLQLRSSQRVMMESPRGTAIMALPEASLLPPLAAPHVTLRLAPTAPAPLERFSRLLAAAPVDFESGWVTAELEGEVTPEGSPSGDLRLRIGDAKGHFRDGRFEGQLELRLNLERFRESSGVADLSGSKVLLRNLSLITSEGRVDGWDATLTLSEASLRTHSRRLIATVNGEASDARPVLLLQRKRPPFARFLTARGLELQAQLDLSPQRLLLPRFQLQGRGLSLRGGILRDGTGTHGALLARVHGFPLGLTFMGREAAASFAVREEWLTRRLEETGMAEAARAAAGRDPRGVGGAGAE